MHMSIDTVALHSTHPNEYRCVCAVNIDAMDVQSDTTRCSQDDVTQLQLYQYCPSNTSLEVDSAHLAQNFEPITADKADEEWLNIVQNL